MANRQFRHDHQALEQGVVHLYVKITFGASGAVASQRGYGVGTVVQETGDGLYTIPLEDSYNELLYPGVMLLDDTASAASTVGIGYRLESEDVDHATAPNVKLQFYALDDGADADPADGAVAYVCLVLRNSSVGAS